MKNDSVLLEELNHEGKAIRIYSSPSNATVERAIVVMLKEDAEEIPITYFERFDIIKSYQFSSVDTLVLELQDTIFNKGQTVEFKIHIPK